MIAVSSEWSQTDIEKNERIKFRRNHLYEISADKQPRLNALYSGKPQAVQSSLWNVKAPNNLISAVVRNWKDNGEDKQFLEVFNKTLTSGKNATPLVMFLLLLLVTALER